MTNSSKGVEGPIKFGPYYLFDFIGKGGMAEIFLAKTLTELGTEKLCVIKRILPHLNKDEEFCEMLINEAKIVANLSHANVVKTLQLGKIEHQYYIAMEYVEGVDLNKLLGTLSRAGSSLPLQFALYIIIETLKGLDYAHRAADASGNPYNIIHRDVSPTNVLISNEGEVKLCDFGIAKVAQVEMESATQHINENHLKGKMAYMAPEHINGDPIDQRADLFTVGILLWELLSGRRLYKSKQQDETFRKAKDAIAPDIVNRGYDEYDMLSSIVKKALSKNVDDRFANGREFIRAIEDYLHATGQVVSQLRFSEFLMENLGDLLMTQRRKREEHAAALSDILKADSVAASVTEEKTTEEEHSPSAFTLSLLSDEDEENAEVESEKETTSLHPDRLTGSTSIADNLAQKFEEEERNSLAPGKKEKSSGKTAVKWILITLALAALGAVGYFAYLKYML